MTPTLLAALDDSAVAGPVLRAAVAMAPLWHAGVEAVHIGDGTGRTARAAAEATGTSLRILPGDVVDRIVREVARDDVVGVVIGARGRPQGARPAGHIAVELITRCAKPVVVVPPDADPPAAARRMLIALEGTRATTGGLEGVVELGREAGVEMIGLHVDTEADIPAFSDQPQHETDAFATEFVSRYWPDRGEGRRLELRVGLPGEEVVAACAETGSDVVVVAWSQNLEPGRARVVRHVLEHCRVPVILVPVIQVPTAP